MGPEGKLLRWSWRPSAGPRCLLPQGSSAGARPPRPPRTLRALPRLLLGVVLIDKLPFPLPPIYLSQFSPKKSRIKIKKKTFSRPRFFCPRFLSTFSSTELGKIANFAKKLAKKCASRAAGKFPSKKYTSFRSRFFTKIFQVSRIKKFCLAHWLVSYFGNFFISPFGNFS